MVNLIRPRPTFTAILLLLTVGVLCEKSSGSGNVEGKVKHGSVSRNGVLVDQRAEESRIIEVEAAEKSYATERGGNPPPIPVPVPVQVRPGALVLPSPGKMQQDMATYESQRVQSQVPPAFQNSQLQQSNRGPPQQHKPPQGQQPPPNQVPQFIHDQPPGPQSQQIQQQQIKLQSQAQLQGPPMIPQPKLEGQRPFQLGGPQPPQGGNFNRLIQGQRTNEHRAQMGGEQLSPPQQKAHNQEQIIGQHNHPVASIGESGVGVVPVGVGAFPGFAPQSEELWPQSSPDLPQIQQLEVKCEKNLMKVAMKFDKPFFGVIFSKGNYDNERCVYVRPGQGRISATFDIAIDGCGTFGSTQNGVYGFGENSGSGSYFENTIVIQYDPSVQEVWDQARKLRCSWHDYYEKSVTFKPFNVEMMDIVHTDFAGDNVGCWMQIQVGKGPWANEVSGIVKIGQTLTMVLAIKDEENKFDMLVRSCVAHDGKRNPIELVDDQGCIVRPKLMSKFTKIKNFGASASVLSYAHLQAFKFPDSMDVHFQCTIQICRHQCPEQCTQPVADFSISRGGLAGHNVGEAVVSEGLLQKPSPFVQGGRPRLERSFGRRFKRDALPTPSRAKSIGVNGNIKVVSSGDFAFNLEANNSGGINSSTSPIVYPLASTDTSGLVCISTPSFTVTLIFLLAILVISCIVSSFLCLRHWRYTGESEHACNADSFSSGLNDNNDIYKPRRPFYHFLWTREKY
ncbi:hypothetical protein CHUAL_005022 [Chamberlinius hualienensis]